MLSFERLLLDGRKECDAVEFCKAGRQGRDAKIATGLIGLAGVLIGGVITPGANYILAVRKERANEKKDTRTHQTEIRK